MINGQNLHTRTAEVPVAALPDWPETVSAAGESVTTLLTAAAIEPAALVISGEAGIGKTTAWAAGVRKARQHGFEVLSARPVASESVLAHTSLADLLSGVSARSLSVLSAPQRHAVNRILLRDDDDEVLVDRRTVAMALLSVIRHRADTSPVLLAIDDAQWLDSASADAISFVTRRLAGRVGVLATTRIGHDDARASWSLQLPTIDRIERMTLGPMSVGSLHIILSHRLGRSLPRPTLIRIHEMSGGNPFYALELAGAMTAATSARSALPGTLDDVVRARIGCLADDVREVLLAAACVESPIVDLVADATDSDSDHVVGLLECAEDAGVVRIEGHRIHFAHPLLAKGVYASAPPSRRRRMHGRLARLVVDPELQARHLALAATSADEHVVWRLDLAAESARNRGEPTAAAELLELSVSVGGDGDRRRMICARDHFAGGDVARARLLLEQTVASAEPGALRAEAMAALARVRMFDDSVDAAAHLLEGALAEVGDRQELRIPMLLALVTAQLQRGAAEAAATTADTALVAARRLGDRELLAKARTARQITGMITGDGVEEDPGQPSEYGAISAAWTGRLDVARALIAELPPSADEYERMWLGFHTLTIEVWQGDFKAAALTAYEATQRAEQCGGDIPAAMAATMNASLAAHAGRVDEARRSIETAVTVSRRCGAHAMATLASGISVFLDVSLGDYHHALETLEPLLAEELRGTEIITAGFVPDAVEALVAVGRLAEADQLTRALETNGGRFDRPWMLAVGARCRAMLHAANGDLTVAMTAVEYAISQHQRLSMPFESARTRLLYGQLQRRDRRKDAAATALDQALSAFTELGAPLWMQRSRAELARTNTGPRRSATLTPAEQRVAELVSTGMTNRDVAGTLFISPKTVEANISRIYRKLDIRSRAELGQRIAHVDGLTAR